MKFWQTYIDRQKAEYLETPFPEDFDADAVVVIPCYDEQELETTLKNLLQCMPSTGKILVAIIINSSIRSKQQIVDQNRKTHQETVRFAQQNNRENIRFFPLVLENLPRKHAGVGLARKIGMDLSILHFLRNEKSDGIIISLDADCKVSPNFLADIETAYRKEKKLCCTVQNFHHRLESEDPVLENAIRQYEEHIRYFSRALQFTGFPYYLHTIGSAFSVSARAYVKTGGMGRQQGGEDFYFLQKVFALENTRFLKEAFVYPLARFSDRIPFGTGPALQKIIDDADGVMKTYSFNAFAELKKLFDLRKSFFRASTDEIENEIMTLHPGVVQFCLETGVVQEIEDSNRNSASYQSFEKRFFHHFNAFKIIKFLNATHPSPFYHGTARTEVDKMETTL